MYELLILDEEIKTAVVRRAPSGEVRALAIARGMKTLKQDGLDLVRSGVTTIEEVFRLGYTLAVAAEPVMASQFMPLLGPGCNRQASAT